MAEHRSSPLARTLLDRALNLSDKGFKCSRHNENPELNDAHVWPDRKGTACGNIPGFRQYCPQIELYCDHAVMPLRYFLLDFG